MAGLEKVFGYFTKKNPTDPAAQGRGRNCFESVGDPIPDELLYR